MPESPVRFVVRRQEHHLGSKIREALAARGLPSVAELSVEFKGYVDVLMGRVEPPYDNGVLTLMETSNAYFARACEIDALIHEGEREGDIFRGSDFYKFRTGELRSYLDLFKRSAELGSRRLTMASLQIQERR